MHWLYGASNICMSYYGASRICTNIFWALDICMDICGASILCIDIYGASNMCMNIYGAGDTRMNICSFWKRLNNTKFATKTKYDIVGFIPLNCTTNLGNRNVSTCLGSTCLSLPLPLYIHIYTGIYICVDILIKQWMNRLIYWWTNWLID